MAAALLPSLGAPHLEDVGIWRANRRFAALNRGRTRTGKDALTCVPHFGPTNARGAETPAPATAHGKVQSRRNARAAKREIRPGIEHRQGRYLLAAAVTAVGIIAGRRHGNGWAAMAPVGRLGLDRPGGGPAAAARDVRRHCGCVRADAGSVSIAAAPAAGH